MVVARITSLLANQMFAYASVKSIAKDKGFEFKYIHEHCSASESSYSSVDKKYGRDFDTIFNIPKEEELKVINTTEFTEHEEFEYIKKYDSFYYKEAEEIEDNTYMKGHFICPKYFYHRIDEVRKWFQFPKEIDEKSENIINNIRKKNPNATVVSVHFRVGENYLLLGFLMAADYWTNAAKRMINKYGKVKFIVFCDKKNKTVDKFIKQFDSVLVRGSLVEDMCCMTKCDAQIIANSTFSMMGALLNPKKNLYVIRPSHYFTGPWSEQKNCFLDEWDIVESKRDVRGFIASALKIGSIRNRFYDMFKGK
nr:alpha-1,2-fucosyltransferase [uncultured Mediterraneibacter sp.]